MSESEIVVRIDAQLAWQMTRTSDDGFIVVCEPLKLTLEGESNEAPDLVIEEGLHYFFQTHLEEGTLGAFLSNHGWRSNGRLPSPEQAQRGEAVQFKVPWTINAP